VCAFPYIESGHSTPVGGSGVERHLRCWAICEQGLWWGLVTYPIRYGSKQKTITHWVPARVLTKKA
jgi:hypothetical protein